MDADVAWLRSASVDGALSIGDARRLSADVARLVRLGHVSATQSGRAIYPWDAYGPRVELRITEAGRKAASA